MRRFISTLLFVFGGWMLMAELMLAFFDMKPVGTDIIVFVIGLFAVLAGLPLLLGAWASPGARWRELGLTILIAVGITLFTGLSAVAVFLDPFMMRYMPPMPDMEFAPIVGLLNLLAISAIGWLLYRRQIAR